MKIIQVITQQEAAGAQSRAVKMMAELNCRGHDVKTVFLYLKRKAFEDCNEIVNIWPRRPRIWEVPLMVFKLWKFLREEKADIVMPYTHWGNVIVAPIAWLAGAKHILANQTQIPSREPKLARVLDIIWGTVGLYDFNICNSRTTEDDMRAEIPAAYAKRLRKVTLGVHIPKSELSKAGLREKYGLPKGVLLAHLGRLSPQKNHENVLRALAKVPETVSMFFVGDGELKNDLQALTDKLGLGKRVIWMGERPAPVVAELLQAGDVFVFPSRWEGFGLAPVEACAAGLPLVASDIYTFHEVLRINEGPFAGQMAALTVDPLNPDSIAAGINAVIANKDTLSSLQAKSKALANQYSLGKMTDDYEAIFKEALVR